MKRIYIAIIVAVVVLVGVSGLAASMQKPSDPILCAGQGICIIDGTAYLFEAISMN